MFFMKLSVVSFVVAAWCWTSGAEALVDVACPGVNPELQCPDGSRIIVTAVAYGLKDDADCSARQKAAKVSKEEGFHELFLGWVKSICDNEKKCRLPKAAASMFYYENWSPDNFIQVSYTCKEEPAGLMTEILCEGESGTITCENGKLVILKAKYGRLDEDTCTNESSMYTFCNSPSAQDRVLNWCYKDGPSSTCTLEATHVTLGQPTACDQLPKYLSVDYVCDVDS